MRYPDPTCCPDVAHTVLGETDPAIEALHRAIDRRDIFLPKVFFDPVLDPLRKDPRFRGIEQRMGVAAAGGRAAH